MCGSAIVATESVTKDYRLGPHVVHAHTPKGATGVADHQPGTRGA